MVEKNRGNYDLPKLSIKDYTKIGATTIAVTALAIISLRELVLPYINKYPARIARAKTVYESFRFPTTIESIVAAETDIKNQEELRYLTSKYTNYLLNVKRAYLRVKQLSPDLTDGGIAYDQEIDFPDLNGNGKIDKTYPPRTTSSKFPDHPTHPDDIIGQEIFHYFTTGYDYQMKLKAWNDVKKIYDYSSKQQGKLQATLKAITQFNEIINKAARAVYPHEKEDLDKYALLAGFATVSFYNNPNDFSLGLNENNQQELFKNVKNNMKGNSGVAENEKLTASLAHLSERAEREGPTTTIVSATLILHYGVENWEKVYRDQKLHVGPWIDSYPERMLTRIDEGMPPALLIPATVAFWQHYKDFKKEHTK